MGNLQDALQTLCDWLIEKCVICGLPTSLLHLSA